MAIKVRVRANPGEPMNAEGTLGKRNLSSMDLYCVYYKDDLDEVPLGKLDVQLPGGQWKSMSEALAAHDVITNSVDTEVMFPPTEEDRARGYTLY